MKAAAGAALLVAVAILLPSPVTAQDPCGVLADNGIGGSIGLVRIPLAGGDHAEGVALGAVWGAPLAGAHAGVAAEHTMLERGAARPWSLRLRLTRRLASLAGVHACGAALAGAAMMSREDHSAWSAAGGLAATLTRPLVVGTVRLGPYVGMRGLGGHASASILDRDVAVNGLSLGGEGGVVAWRDRGSVALRVSADGFDPALGATPYPDLAVRLIAAWRF